MRLFAKGSLVKPKPSQACVLWVAWLKQVAVLAVIGLGAWIAAAPAAWGQVSLDLVYTFTGEAAGDNFGLSVSGAGDVNNDGYDDLIVGAWMNDAGGDTAGRAYVFSGLDGDTLHIFTGEAVGDCFGRSVSGAGDVNEDGYADLIVGAYGNDAGGGWAGRAYVYSGQTGALLWTFTGEAVGDRLGSSVSGAGDVNNDGYADLIVGATGASSWAGQAYVFSGLEGNTLHVFTGAAVGDYFGESVSGAGDVNEDGYADLIVGAYGNDAGGSDAGRAYVFSGLDGDILHMFTGEAADNHFGISVSGAGDVNNDGYDDLIVSADRNSAGGDGAGRAYVFSGLDGDTLHIFTGEAAYDYFGNSVSGAGDLNNDEYADLIVGNAYNNAGGQYAGRAYVYSGQTGDLLRTLTGKAAGDFLGCSVSGAGDVNNDGHDELIVGAHGAANFAGQAYVYAPLPDRRVLVTPGPDTSAFAVTDVAVKFFIQNTGALADVYDIDVTDSLGWNLDSVYYEVALDPGQVDSISVTVSVPIVAPGTIDRIFATAVSRADTSVRDSASLTVTCNAYLEDWALTPGDDLSGSSNSHVTAVFYVRNTGLALDSCHLTLSDSLGWDIEPQEHTITLNSGQQDSVFFDINIPAVPLGTTNKVTLTGLSLTNPYVADTASLRVTCESYNVAIREVSDVGNDQGKQVKISWSSFPGDDPSVTHFTVFRREDPLLFASPMVRPKTFSSKDYPPGDWFMVDTYPAYGETLYLAAVPTLKDSTIAEGMYWSVFFVRAGTDNPTVYFDSPVDSGYSLDNLSPSPPAGLIASHEPSATVLSWTGTDDADFDYYAIYRDTLSGFDPDASNRLGYTVDTILIDSDAELGRTYYYLASAFDFSGNESDPSNEAVGARYVTGDANANGVVEPGDVVYLINYLFRNDPPPSPYEAGDCNCDGEVGPGDVVYLLNYLFRGWPPPTC